MQVILAKLSLDVNRSRSNNDCVPTQATPVTQATQEAASTSPRRRRVILAVLCLSVVLTVVGNMALNIALPTLGRDLHASATSLQWVVDIYVLCFAGLLLPGGAVGDRFGRKGCLQIGLAVYALAAALGAFAPGTGELMAARAVMGCAAALIMPGTLSILATVFPPAQRPTAIAIWASVAGASVAASITWSGLMLEHFWWGSIFLGMAALALVALLTGIFLLPRSRALERQKLDLIGALLSVAGIAGLLYGFIEAPVYGWTSPQVLGPLLIGLVILGVFAYWEHRSAHPMLDPGFVTSPRLLLGSLAIAGVYFALFGMYFDFTQYLQLVRGYSPVVAALYALPAGLAQLATANAARKLAARHGARLVLTGGLVASAAGLLILSASGVRTPPLLSEAGLALLGAGIGLAMPPSTGAIMAALPPAKAGVGSAINDLDRELGGAFGVGLLGSLTLARYKSAVTAAHPTLPPAAREGLAQAIAVARTPAAVQAARTAFTSGLDLAMAVGSACVLATAVIVAWKMPRHHPAQPTRPDPPAAILAQAPGGARKD
jgi:EmrB/QacA subfamily drug resistance transporter